jgi:hypothetical protein
MNKGSLFSRIVVKFQADIHLPYNGIREINDFFWRNDIIQWKGLLRLFPGISINKLFTSLKPEEIIKWVIKARKSDTEYQPPDFLSYYTIDCLYEISKDKLLKKLLKNKNVELAYIETGTVFPPSVYANKNPLTIQQGYLNPAPTGINAKYAWNYKGGDGSGEVKFIDIEQGWLLHHEDIVVKTVPVTGINQTVFADHGAAVLGVIMMRDNSVGGIGITPRVNGYVISQWRTDGSLNTADAVMAAIRHLKFGDILLLEAQVLDPSSGKKLWPVEIHEAIFQVIRLATALGITVIEAAANGSLYYSVGNDLDSFTLNNKKILDPLSPDFMDSGAIIVTAASSSSPHTTMHNSNYGNRVNCYAWGECVTTAGLYPGSSGIAINTYTRKFNGTSSASAIIAGAAIAVQSIVEASGKARLSPKQMRNILSNELFGTPSENGQTVDKIGVMPDLKKIINNALNFNLNFFIRNKVTFTKGRHTKREKIKLYS